MSYYDELNELYIEKIANPGTQYAVRTHRNYRNGLDEKFMIGSDSIWSDDAQNIIKKRAPKTSAKNMLKSREAVNNNHLTHKLRSNLTELQTDFSPSAAPQPQSSSRFKAAPPTQTTDTNNTSVLDKVKQWREDRAVAKRDKIHQRNQMKQEKDNLRIEKEYKLRQALKNPSFRSDAPDPKTNNQSLLAAIKGNVPQGGDRNQAITAKTSVFANPNNQSSMGRRILSWGKNNPRVAAGYALAAAGAGTAAYGLHKIRQLKNKQQQQDQQSEYPQVIYHTASEYLDELCLEKIASIDVADLAEQIPDRAQDNPVIMDKLQEVAKYTKKEDVPGGKSAPSKLVQRKNKERFKK